MRPPLTLNAQLRWDPIRRWVDRLAPASIVEFGVGQGAMGLRLAEGRHYRGVEPDDTSRAIAAAVVPSTGTVSADASDIEAGSVEMVCAFEVLEHIPDDVAALTEWAALVAPGGHVLLSVPAWNHKMGEWDERVGHLRRYSPEMLREVASAAGLDTVAIESVGFPLGTVLERARNEMAKRRPSAAETADDRTASSARQLQPKPWMGAATIAATAPFRLLQRTITNSSLSTCFVLVARKPL